MIRRFLTGIGVLAILGVGAASVAALFALREKVHVTVAGETSAAKAGPDPIVLLRDDVAGLRRDLAGLAETLGKNFEALAGQADADEAARRAALEGAQAPLRADLAALRERVDAAAARVDALAPATASDLRDAAHRTESAVSALAARLERLEGLVAARGAAPAPAPVTPAPTTLAPAPPTPAAPPATGPATKPAVATTLPPPPPPAASTAPAADRPTTTPPATAPAAGPPAPAAAARRRTFLALSLPSQGTDFSKALRFEVLPELSRVGFDAKSTLHAFSGVTSDVSGSFTARLSAPGAEVAGDVRAQAGTLDTGLADRNREMYGVLDTAQFPDLAFHLASFAATSTDPRTLATTGTARGTLTVKGRSVDVVVPLRISVDDARRVVVEGEVSVRLTDFGIPPPRKLVITVDDELRVWVALRARAVGGAS